MIACLPTLLLLDLGIGTAPGGLSPSGTFQQWEYGNTVVAGFAGTVWATRLAAPYLNDTVELLEIPLPDLSGADRPVLMLDHHYDLGPGDRAFVEVDEGAGFVPVPALLEVSPAFSGTSGGFVESGFDLSGLGPGARVRLKLAADDAGSGPGWFVRGLRFVDGDPVPPRVEVVTSPSDTQDLTGPYVVRVAITEDVRVDEAAVYWEAAGQAGRVDLAPSADTWVAALPAAPPDATVQWRADVTDCASTTTRIGPSFRVFLAAPTDLQGPRQPHAVARTATLSWSPPVSPYPVIRYEVWDLLDGTVTEATTTSAEVPLTPEGQEFAVRAIYPAGPGDLSEPLVLDVEVPELRSVTPAVAWPGDRVYVSIEGRSLYLIDGLTALQFTRSASGAAEFGAGVEVEALEVRDVNRALARVFVSPDAVPGPRALVVSGAHGAFSFPDVFDVLDAADAPRIVSVEPRRIEQGAEARVVFTASQPFAGPVTVTTDEEMFDGGDAVVDGETATITIAALGRARTGLHTVVLDDGARLWSAEIEVTAFRYEARKVCATAPGAGWAWIAGLLIVARRRSTCARRDRTAVDRGLRGTTRPRTPPH